MIRCSVIGLLAVALAGPAVAADNSISGSGGLALAALVGAHSPKLSAADKSLLAGLFAGDLALANRTHRQVVVLADSVLCRESTVDLTKKECTLGFGGQSVELKGLEAYAIFATLALARAPSQGGAGMLYEGALSFLSCTIDPQLLSAGGGASCGFRWGGA